MKCSKKKYNCSNTTLWPCCVGLMTVSHCTCGTHYYHKQKECLTCWDKQKYTIIYWHAHACNRPNDHNQMPCAPVGCTVQIMKTPQKGTLGIHIQWIDDMSECHMNITTAIPYTKRKQEQKLCQTQHSSNISKEHIQRSPQKKIMQAEKDLVQARKQEQVKTLGSLA